MDVVLPVAVTVGAALVLIVVLTALFRIGVPIVVKYTRAMAHGHGVGKTPDITGVRREPVKAPKDGHEPAYDHYLVRQVWADTLHSHRLGLRTFWASVESEWTRIQELYLWPKSDADHPSPMRRPVRGYLLAVNLSLGMLVAGGFLLAAAVAAATFSGLLVLAAWVLRYVLRAAGVALPRLRGITKTCRHCGLRVGLAMYACDWTCDARHGDLRPGRYGLLGRTCACGRRMPSLALPKSYGLPAWCPKCAKPLAHGTGKNPEIVLPVFGAPMAGKTQLITVALVALEAILDRTGGSFEYGDKATRGQIEKSRRTLELSQRTEATPPTSAVTQTIVHPAYTLRIRPRRGRHKTIHIFDAAGESFLSAQRIAQLSYLRLANTLVFVIDPLSISSLWRRLGEENGRQEALKDRRAQTEPYVVFTETVQSVIDIGINTMSMRLSVAVSKADLVPDLVGGLDGRNSKQIRDWLVESLHQGNMIRAMEQHFEQVVFSLIASTMDDGAARTDLSVENFVRATLDAEGLNLFVMSGRN